MDLSTSTSLQNIFHNKTSFVKHFSFSNSSLLMNTKHNSTGKLNTKTKQRGEKVRLDYKNLFSLVLCLSEWIYIAFEDITITLLLGLGNKVGMVMTVNCHIERDRSR